uniref:hypothetical protein n=1 Tax=Neorhizobium sp. EC2-8 TaxID=3129230 RepID=UPI0031016E74
MQMRRKPSPGEQRQYLTHSIYAAGLGAPDARRYRSTPSGAPDVAALVHPGMVIRTSYGTGGTVIGVEAPMSMSRLMAASIRISRSSMCPQSRSGGTASSIATGSTNASPSTAAS